MKIIGKEAFKIVWYFLRRYKIPFIFLIGMAIFTGIVESFNVALIYPILGEGLNTDLTDNPFLNFINIFANLIPIDDSLVRYCLLFIVIALIVFASKVLYFFFSIRLRALVAIDTKKEVFNKCIGSDYQFFIDNKQGEVLYRITQAPNNIARILEIISSIFIELFLSFSIFVLLLSLSWKGTLIILVGGIAYYYLNKYLSIKVSYRAGKKKLSSSQDEAVIVTEFTSGIKQIKVFETFNYWRDMFDKALHTFWKYQRKDFFWTRVPEVLIILLLYLSIGITVISIKFLYPGEFQNTLPLIGTFAFAVFLILPKISVFGRYRMNFMNLLPLIESVYKLLREAKYNKIINGTKVFKGLKSSIEIRDVTYSHKNRGILLKDITLKIEKDTTTAIVGASGSGKTTIVDLILRLYDTSDGGVYVDDVNIKEFDIFTFLKTVGYVSQETFIYNATLKENISFGGEYTDQEIINAAKLANADEFIQQFPEKYDTIVGDRGTRLSGGERQRVAIARAMIRKPEILILDEATSSLDNISENVVQKAINKVSESCTTFIIAHRLSTIQNADVIYVLDNGKVVESGTHKQLLTKKGKYWDLYNIQKN